jgi:hypothetical protein
MLQNNFLGSTPNQTVSMTMVYGGVAAYSASFAASGINQRPYSLGFAGTISSNYDYFSDGKFNRNITVGSINANTQEIALCGDPVFNRGSQGNYHALYYWERRLTSEDMASLDANPYQFLIPA